MTERRRGRPPGPRIRSIKPEMPQDERIAKLSIPAELLFVRLISMADDEGRFRAAVNGIIGFAFPDREDVTQAKVRRWLREIEAQELVLLYAHDGGRYGVVRNFRKHQQINKATPSRLPEPPDAEIVAANAIPPEVGNSSGTNTGVVPDAEPEYSDSSHAGARAGARAPIPDPRSSSCSSTTKKDSQQRGAREHGKVDQLTPPRELAAMPEVASRLDPVLTVLVAVQAERGGAVPTVRGVGLALVAYPGRDHLGVARELQHWALAGRGQRKPVKDWVRTYRTFLDGAEDAAPSRAATTQGGVDALIEQVRRRGQQADVIEGSAAA
jgi:hypothetical protein